MSATLAPRVVVVSRRSEHDELLRRHGTRAAAAYFLKQRGREIDGVEELHHRQEAALSAVSAAVPADWRRGRADRDDLSRFLFGPEDIVVTVGQDGLVANVAKYLRGQPVIGVNPDPARNPGVLARFAMGQVAKLLPAVVARAARMQARTMAVATLDDGQQLIGLNEIYIGHESHQSARYLITQPDGRFERQSSSGVVVGTGTGATGWCSSIAIGRGLADRLPRPDEAELCWFVREAWPSPGTGTALTAGRLRKTEVLTLTSESERLVVFADGVEADRLVLIWGQCLTVGVGERHLNLVVA